MSLFEIGGLSWVAFSGTCCAVWALVLRARHRRAGQHHST
jgi:hypothetical protein